MEALHTGSVTDIRAWVDPKLIGWKNSVRQPSRGPTERHVDTAGDTMQWRFDDEINLSDREILNTILDEFLADHTEEHKATCVENEPVPYDPETDKPVRGRRIFYNLTNKSYSMRRADSQSLRLELLGQTDGAKECELDTLASIARTNRYTHSRLPTLELSGEWWDGREVQFATLHLSYNKRPDELQVKLGILDKWIRSKVQLKADEYLPEDEISSGDKALLQRNLDKRDAKGYPSITPELAELVLIHGDYESRSQVLKMQNARKEYIVDTSGHEKAMLTGDDRILRQVLGLLNNDHQPVASSRVAKLALTHGGYDTKMQALALHDLDGKRMISDRFMRVMIQKQDFQTTKAILDSTKDIGMINHAARFGDDDSIRYVLKFRNLDDQRLADLRTLKAAVDNPRISYETLKIVQSMTDDKGLESQLKRLLLPNNWMLRKPIESESSLAALNLEFPKFGENRVPAAIDQAINHPLRWINTLKKEASSQ
jgi:hypothetical protein